MYKILTIIEFKVGLYGEVAFLQVDRFKFSGQIVCVYSKLVSLQYVRQDMYSQELISAFSAYKLPV